jgi:hypothetical protein
VLKEVWSSMNQNRFALHSDSDITSKHASQFERAQNCM